MLAAHQYMATKGVRKSKTTTIPLECSDYLKTISLQELSLRV